MPKTCQRCDRPVRGPRSRYCLKCKKAVNKAARDSWVRRNPEKVAEWRRESIRKIKQEVLAHYGGRCACCGEDNLLFLTIDHIDGNGTAHRKSVGRYGSTFYSWLRTHGLPLGFQVLCFNCNCGRQLNGGICPGHN